MVRQNRYPLAGINPAETPKMFLARSWLKTIFTVIINNTVIDLICFIFSKGIKCFYSKINREIINRIFRENAIEVFDLEKKLGEKL